MKRRIVYIILFLASFLLPSIAQIASIDFKYVDGTKSSESISSEMMSVYYKHKSGTKNRTIKRITIDNIFDTICPSGVDAQFYKGNVYPELTIYFDTLAYPSKVTGPNAEQKSMGNLIAPYRYGFDFENFDSGPEEETKAAISFYSYMLPNFAFHNGKQVSTINGRIIYTPKTNASLNVLDEELIKGIQPFYFDPEWKGQVSDSILKFVAPSNQRPSDRDFVGVVSNLKQLGYFLSSPKGVFPLIYQKDEDNSVQVCENYLLVKTKR